MAKGTKTKSEKSKDPAVIERVGLLFVHGIGEQARFQHLRDSVLELAEIIRTSDQDATVTVVDDTKDWPHQPGAPENGGPPPVTRMVSQNGKSTHFECHEVWWADLGGRCGVADTVRFWTW